MLSKDCIYDTKNGKIEGFRQPVAYLFPEIAVAIVGIIIYKYGRNTTGLGDLEMSEDVCIAQELSKFQKTEIKKEKKMINSI